MKFAMGAETLTVLTKQTSSANDDLGSLVKQLFAAAEPIQDKFNGAGRAAFDKFKGETDQIANELNSALAAVLGGIQGQNTAFITGEQQMVDETTAAQAGANFESARFSGRWERTRNDHACWKCCRSPRLRHPGLASRSRSFQCRRRPPGVLDQSARS